MVGYERTFSWTELTSCSDDGGSALVQVTETDETVTLSGTFYVELVSPYTMSSGDYYRTAVLLQQDFGIALMRQVNVLASTGVNLFISTIMAYGRADDESSYSSMHCVVLFVCSLLDDDGVGAVDSLYALSLVLR